MISHYQSLPVINNQMVQESNLSDLKENELDEAIHGFEEAFLETFLNIIGETAFSSSYFGDDFSGDVIRSLFVRSIAEKINDGGKIGLASQIKAQMAHEMYSK